MASTHHMYMWYYIGTLFVVNYLTSVSASNTSCPTWFYFNNATQQCECRHQVGMIRCNQQEKKVKVFHGHCVTYAGQEGLYYIGYCPFVIKSNTNGLFFELPSDPDNLTEVMCGAYNRKGLLCGRCIDRYGPAVFSFENKCADCSEHSTGYNVILYLSLKLIPITLFFMCVLFFHLNITAGPLLGYVIFCQVYMIALKDYSYIYEYIFLMYLNLLKYSCSLHWHYVIYGYCNILGLWSHHFALARNLLEFIYNCFIYQQPFIQ